MIATLVATAGVASAAPDYSQALDDYTLERAKEEVAELARAEGIEVETAQVLLELDVFATSRDTGCPGVDVDVINATSRTVWNVEIEITQKDAGKSRTDKLHLPYMLAHTKVRASVSCLQDYTYRSRYDYGSSTPISLTYSAKGSKSLDEALPLLLAQNKDYMELGGSIAPRPDTSDGVFKNLLEDALSMDDSAVAKELVLAIARTGVGKKELGEALARNGTGVIADEVANAMSKLPPAQQAQIARTLLASSVADRWKDQLGPMIDRKLCSGPRGDVIALWIQAQGEEGIPIAEYRDKVRDKCKPTKADGPGMVAALEKDPSRTGDVVDAIEADLFASTVASWKAQKGGSLAASHLAYLTDGQSQERFMAAVGVLAPDQLPAAIAAALRSPDGAAVAAKASWVLEAAPKVDAEQISYVVTNATDDLVTGHLPSGALRDAAKSLAKLAPEAAESVIVAQATSSSKIFDVSKLKAAGIDMGEFLAFNANLGDCTATADTLVACAEQIAAYKDGSGAGALVKLAKDAVRPEFVSSMRSVVDPISETAGLVTVATKLSAAGFDTSFVVERACTDAKNAISYGGDPSSYIELAEQVAPNASCIEDARDAVSARQRRSTIFAILAIMGLVLPLPAGGFLMKRRWKKVQKELPPESTDEAVTGATLDDRLGARGLGRGLADGVSLARRDLAGTPVERALAGVDDTVLGLATSTVKRAATSGDAATALVKRGDHALYLVALPVRHPRPQVVQRYLGAPWPEHMAQIQRAAGLPVLAVVVLCGPDAAEASLLVGYGDGTTVSDPDVLLDAKEARDRGANKFRHVISLSTDSAKAA